MMHAEQAMDSQEMAPDAPTSRRERILRAAFARLDVKAMAVAMGAVSALALAGATCLLLIKGAPAGVAVGSHLELLSNFLPGYAVSGTGALLGLVYGFLIGGLLGGFVAVLWNVSHYVYIMIMALRYGSAGD